MTDPDNRRPVDFKMRAGFLENLQQAVSGNVPLTSLLNNWTDGRIKLFLTNRALEFRRSHADLFLEGDYVPVYASRRIFQHVCAFMRTYKGQSVLVAVPRFTTALTRSGEFPLGARAWRKNRLGLPAGTARHWNNIFTGEHIETEGRTRGILLSRIFSQFPVALLSSS
jgi:(1->4)-alpha-D-glucan 1-alpha-D-glucosylmutase